MTARHLLRRLAARAGYHVTRLPPNRFDAMGVVLQRLRDVGFRPQVVIDGGANCGAWTKMARAIFADAEFHLIEPQPACHAALARLGGRVFVYRVAVTRPGVTEVLMAGTGSTGAWVLAHGSSGVDHVKLPASTLDALVSAKVSPADRPLLKLDLEGHELEALEGGHALMRSVEAIVTEVQFFDIGHNDFPIFADVVAYLREHEFELYDIVALASRPSDGRLRMGDAVFVRRESDLLKDVGWA